MTNKAGELITLVEMIKLKQLTSVLFLILVCQGCSTPYYGHSEQSWQRLSEDDRAVLKEEYRLIVDSKKEQAHKDLIDARTQSIITLGAGGLKY